MVGCFCLTRAWELEKLADTVVHTRYKSALGGFTEISINFPGLGFEKIHIFY